MTPIVDVRGCAPNSGPEVEIIARIRLRGSHSSCHRGRVGSGHARRARPRLRSQLKFSREDLTTTWSCALRRVHLGVELRVRDHGTRPPDALGRADSVIAPGYRDTIAPASQPVRRASRGTRAVPDRFDLFGSLAPAAAGSLDGRRDHALAGGRRAAPSVPQDRRAAEPALHRRRRHSDLGGGHRRRRPLPAPHPHRPWRCCRQPGRARSVAPPNRDRRPGSSTSSSFSPQANGSELSPTADWMPDNLAQPLSLDALAQRAPHVAPDSHPAGAVRKPDLTDGVADQRSHRSRPRTA